MVAMQIVCVVAAGRWSPACCARLRLDRRRPDRFRCRRVRGPPATGPDKRRRLAPASRRDRTVRAGRHGARPARRAATGTAAPIRRVRLQRVHAVRLRRSTASRCRARCASSSTTGEPVDAERSRAGRSAVLRDDRPGASHVAIAIGGDEFVHAPSSTGVVRVERLSSTLLVAAISGRARAFTASA